MKFKLDCNGKGYYIQFPKEMKIDDALEFVELINEMPKAVKELDEIFEKAEKTRKKYKDKLKDIPAFYLPEKPEKPLWKKLCDPFYERIFNRNRK